MEPEAPLISVIIGVYNGARYLGEAIESVFGQTYERRELIVVDDGSDDGSSDVALGYGDAVRCIRHEERRGNGAARNTAIAASSGEYLAFLDADDRFMPEKLELQMRAFEEDADLDVAFGHVSEFISPELDPELAARLRRPAVDFPMRAPNLMLIKASSFDRVGPFSTTLRVGVTVDWYARAVEAGLKETIIPSVVLERRLHDDNNGLRERNSRPEYLHVLKAALDRRRAATVAES